MSITLTKAQRKLQGDGQTWEISDASLRETIFVTQSNNSTLKLTGLKPAKVVVEGCRGCTITVSCLLVSGIVELIRCRDCTVSADQDVPTFTADISVDCRIVISRDRWLLSPLRHAIYSTSCAGLVVELSTFVEGAPPAKVIQVPDGDSIGSSQVTHPVGAELVTEPVIWDGAGHATTEKEKAAADERDQKLLDAVVSAFVRQIKPAAAPVPPPPPPPPVVPPAAPAPAPAPSSELLAEVAGFKASGLRHVETHVTHAVVQARDRGDRSYGHQCDEDIKERFDSEEQVDAAAHKLADLIRASKHMVIFTGAGVSTSSKIPDYRGPSGVWTLRDRGLQAKMEITLEEATPSRTHMAVQALVGRGICSFVVSTNVDGLHRRSGVPAEKLAELHGNAYLEICRACGKDYLRTFDTHAGRMDHLTGRICDVCGGPLFDSIINFGENLPEEALRLATEHSRQSDLAVVLGTSMMVMPAASLPLMARKMVIVNLQKTPYDGRTELRVFARTDDLMRRVMAILGIEIPEFAADQIATTATATKGKK